MSHMPFRAGAACVQGTLLPNAHLSGTTPGATHGPRGPPGSAGPSVCPWIPFQCVTKELLGRDELIPWLPSGSSRPRACTALGVLRRDGPHRQLCNPGGWASAGALQKGSRPRAPPSVTPVQHSSSFDHVRITCDVSEMESPGTCVRLFVGGLTPGTSSADVRARFEPFGEVTACDLAGPKLYGGDTFFRGFGHVDLIPKAPAFLARCLATYNGCKWRGGVLRCALARPDFAQRELEAQSELETFQVRLMRGSMAGCLRGSLGPCAARDQHARGTLTQDVGFCASWCTLRPAPCPGSVGSVEHGIASHHL